LHLKVLDLQRIGNILGSAPLNSCDWKRDKSKKIMRKRY